MPLTVQSCPGIQQKVPPFYLDFSILLSYCFIKIWTLLNLILLCLQNELSGNSLDRALSLETSNEIDYLHDDDWLGKDKHVFILSSAGKPIYSR